jgi:hypothetical protein
MVRRVQGAWAAILMLSHHLLGIPHFDPPDYQPTIRRERREQHTEHLPEQALAATQPQAPVVEQAPPVLSGLTDGGWMDTLDGVAALLRRQRTVPQSILAQDGWVPALPVLPGLTDGAGWMTTLNVGFFQRRRPILPMPIDDWVPTPPAERPDQPENKK